MANSENDRKYRWREANLAKVAEQQRQYRQKNLESIRARDKAYRSRPDIKERTRLRNRARKYGLTMEQVAEQEKITHCQSCGTELLTHGKSNNAKVFDHCHGTGNFRGVLCSGCNKALGCVNDDPVKLQALIDYLKNHDAKQ